MIRALVALVTLAASADALVPFKAMPLRLKVPAAWEHTMEDTTHRFDAPSQDASFKLDIGAVAAESAPMKPELCRSKILDGLGKDGWKMMTVGKAPAAKKVYRDSEGEGDKKVEVETLSYIGCDGRTTWALTFTSDVKQKDRVAKVAEQIVKSIEYLQGGEDKK
jgi:hypothetical protein